jgi:hypothetical protein
MAINFGLMSGLFDIQTYLQSNTLPDNDVAVEYIFRMARKYALIEEDLYRRNVNEIFLKCISR